MEQHIHQFKDPVYSCISDVYYPDSEVFLISLSVYEHERKFWKIKTNFWCNCLVHSGCLTFITAKIPSLDF